MAENNNSIDFSLLSAYAGDYRLQLIKQLYNAMNIQNEGFTVRPNIKSKETLHKLLVKKGAKPYTGVFKSKAGDVGYEPRELAVEKAQRDLSIEPSKYIGTFMEHLRGAGENAANMTVPFAEFMWKAVMEELGTELNLETVYHGVGKAGFAAYNAGTAYTVGALIKYTQDSELRYFRALAATTAGQNPDTNPEKWEWAGARAITIGLGKRLLDSVSAGDLTPVATGAVDSNNAYAKFTQLFRSHAEPVKMGKVGNVFTYCSITDYESLMDDYENKIKKQFDEVNGIIYLAKTDRINIIKPVSWLSGSRRLISTVSGNLQAGTDQLSDMNVIKIIEQMYHLDAGLTFMLGFNFQDEEVLRISDQA